MVVAAAGSTVICEVDGTVNIGKALRELVEQAVLKDIQECERRI